MTLSSLNEYREEQCDGRKCLHGEGRKDKLRTANVVWAGLRCHKWQCVQILDRPMAMKPMLVAISRI